MRKRGRELEKVGETKHERNTERAKDQRGCASRVTVRVTAEELDDHRWCPEVAEWCPMAAGGGGWRGLGYVRLGLSGSRILGTPELDFVCQEVF